MEKPAPTDHPVHDLIRRRWSPRTFAEDPVDEPLLRSLFEAARWAPSSFNDQPWSFLVGRRGDSSGTRLRLLDCLTEGNRAWAKTAPVLALSVARLRFRHNDEPNRHNDEPNRHALHDTGLALENLILEALHRGLFAHPMAGFHADRAREAFDIPDAHEPVTAIALGYPADEGNGTDGNQRERKPLEEFVFGDRWGSTSAVVG